MSVLEGFTYMMLVNCPCCDSVLRLDNYYKKGTCPKGTRFEFTIAIKATRISPEPSMDFFPVDVHEVRRGIYTLEHSDGEKSLI